MIFKDLIKKYFEETSIQKGLTGLQIPVSIKKQFITQALSLPYSRGKEIGHFSKDLLWKIVIETIAFQGRLTSAQS